MKPERTAHYIRKRTGQGFHLAVILGSGLGAVADIFSETHSLSYKRIPGFFDPWIPGHAGQLIFGELYGKRIIFLQGRYHLYEGYTPAQAGYPVRVLKELGVPRLLVTNAAGGISKALKSGDLMVLKDHINLTDLNPLTGYKGPKTLFVDMSQAYSSSLSGLILKSGKSVQQGVYAYMHGPSYETPAEVEALRRLGADAVGMSTVPEVITAVQEGMEIAGLSLITNMAAGTEQAVLDHSDVIKTSASSIDRIKGLLKNLIRKI